jgi:hypothetical protein
MSYKRHDHLHLNTRRPVIVIAPRDEVFRYRAGKTTLGGTFCVRSFVSGRVANPPGMQSGTLTVKLRVV